MKIRVGDIRQIIAEELGAAKAQLGMAPSSSVSPEQARLWRDKEARGAVQGQKSKKEQEMLALKKRIADLKAAQLAAVQKYQQLATELGESVDKDGVEG